MNAPLLGKNSAPTGPESPPTLATLSFGPIQFRFVLKFAPQLSTPCSRGVAVKPRAGRIPSRGAPRLFQSYLQRHSVLQ